MENDLFKALNDDLQALVTDECLTEGIKKIDQQSHLTKLENTKHWY